MTPQELKNSILQLAIQGKLVEQRADEGTGAELLEKILAAKNAEGAKGKGEKFHAKSAKSAKVGSCVSRDKIPDDEKPFDIPESWEWVRLRELCSIATGRRDANFGSPDGKYNFFTCAKNPIKCHSFSFTGESLLLAGNGDIGNITYFWGKFEAYQRTYVLHPYLEGSYLIYLYYHLQSNWVQYNTGMVYGTAIPYIRLGNVQNYLVALPPLAEQKRIVAKIEELMPLVERYEKAWSKLKDFNKRFPADMQKSLLQMAIQGKLVEHRPEEGTGEELYRQIQTEKQRLVKSGKIKKEKPLPEIAEAEIPFDIPDSWKWVRLQNIVSVLGDGIHGTPVFDEAGEYYFVNGNNLVNGSIVVKVDTKKVSVGEYDKYKKPLDENSILISINGTIGNYAFYAGEPIILGKSACYFSVLIGVDKKYILHLLNTKFFTDYAVKEATQTTIKNVSLKAMRMFPIPLPPLAEQKRIVAKLEELLPLCERLK